MTNATNNPELCDDDVITQPAPQPILSIRKVITTKPNYYKVGSVLTYDLVITNVNPAVKVTQINVKDDCGATKLENCKVTSTFGTYTQSTGLLTGIVWAADNTITVKVEGTVKAGTTGNVINTAKLDPSTPVDPANPTLPLPTCAKDPLMTNATNNPELCDDDVITPQMLEIMSLPIPLPILHPTQTVRTGGQVAITTLILILLSIAAISAKKRFSRNIK